MPAHIRLLAGILVSLLVATAAPAHAAERWRPPQNALLSVIFTDLPNTLDELFATIGKADIVELDAFNAEKETIAAIHAKGKKVVCYVNFGSWENWRSDSGNFPESVIGNSYKGWPGEFWLDIRQVAVLTAAFIPRIQMAKEKGCDGIDSDNMNGYENKTGFPLTRSDQIRFNVAIAEAARNLGMPIGMKNGSDIVPEMVSHFDWATIESCFADNLCGGYAPFVNADKAVFNLEYDNGRFWTEDLCPAAAKHGVSAMMVNLELDGWREACNPPLSEVEKLFDWAETRYPDLFSRQHKPTASLAGYTYRCYDDRNTCLATRGNRAYYLTRPDKLFDLGEISKFWPY